MRSEIKATLVLAGLAAGCADRPAGAADGARGKKAKVAMEQRTYRPIGDARRQRPDRLAPRRFDHCLPPTGAARRISRFESNLPSKSSDAGGDIIARSAAFTSLGSRTVPPVVPSGQHIRPL